jgi:hypothetical protein
LVLAPRPLVMYCAAPSVSAPQQTNTEQAAITKLTFRPMGKIQIVKSVTNSPVNCLSAAKNLLKY